MQTEPIARRFRAVPRDRYEAMLEVVRAVGNNTPYRISADGGHECAYCFADKYTEPHFPDCPWERARAVLAEIGEEGT